MNFRELHRIFGDKPDRATRYFQKDAQSEPSSDEKKRNSSSLEFKDPTTVGSNQREEEKQGSQVHVTGQREVEPRKQI